MHKVLPKVFGCVIIICNRMQDLISWFLYDVRPRGKYPENLDSEKHNIS